MEDYCDAKAQLFRQCEAAVCNGDDPWTPRLLKDATCQVRTYGVKSEADLRAENVVLSANGIACLYTLAPPIIYTCSSG